MTKDFKTADDANAQKESKQASHVSEKINKWDRFFPYNLGEKRILDENGDNSKVIFCVFGKKINQRQVTPDESLVGNEIIFVTYVVRVVGLQDCLAGEAGTSHARF